MNKKSNKQNFRIRMIVYLMNEIQNDWEPKDLARYPENLPSFDELTSDINRIEFK